MKEKLRLNISNETFMQINLFARTMIIVPLPIMGLWKLAISANLNRHSLSIRLKVVESKYNDAYLGRRFIEYFKQLWKDTTTPKLPVYSSVQ